MCAGAGLLRLVRVRLRRRKGQGRTGDTGSAGNTALAEDTGSAGEAEPVGGTGTAGDTGPAARAPRARRLPTVRRHVGRAAAFVGRHSTATLIVVVTAALYAVAWPTLHLTHEVPAPLQPMIAALAAWPFLLVRVNPLLGWSISLASAIVIPLAFERTPQAPGGPPWQVVHIIVLLVLFAVVCLAERPPAVVGAWAGTVVVFAVYAPGSDGAGRAIGLTALLVFCVLLRRLWLSRRQLARQQEVSRVERGRRAVLEERARIARDLHDVVAHHMSLVVVQAQTARYRVEGVTPAAAQEFDAIAVTARDALNEVRTMLGVLRSDGETAETAPQPGADRIGELVEARRRAGIAVHYSAEGDVAGIRPAAGVVLYRIAQESLSNATRHAPGSAVEVLLAAGPEVVLEVRNASAEPPGGRGGDDGGAGGSGIRGMRERAEAVGGTLSAGAEGDAFVVRCRIPSGGTGGDDA